MDCKVILGTHDLQKGDLVRREFLDEGVKTDVVQIEVDNQNSTRNAVENIIDRFGRLDILINNAGILLDRGTSVLTIGRTTIETNFYGALALIQQVIPYMKNNHYGRIVNISSGIAAFEPIKISHPSL